MSRSEQFTIKDVWKATNGGEDIFRQHLDKISFTKNVSAPWRKDDNPSLRLKSRGGVVYYTDYGGDQSHGNAIDFLMYIRGITFTQALKEIKKGYIGKVTTWEKKKSTSKELIIYEFDSQPFSKEHHKYWNKYYLSEDFVKEGDIYAVKNWAINKKKQLIGDCELVFGYVFKDLWGEDTGLRKILRIGTCVEKKDKWRTNIPNNQLWYGYKYIGKEIDKLFIAKSNKDALINMYHTIPSMATQSENDVILAQNIPKLLTICSNLILNFGSDPQGTQASINVSKEFNLPWFNTPKSYLKFGVNDNAEYQAEFGPDCFKQLLIDKKYLC